MTLENRTYAHKDPYNSEFGFRDLFVAPTMAFDVIVAFVGVVSSIPVYSNGLVGDSKFGGKRFPTIVPVATSTFANIFFTRLSPLWG